MMPSSWFYGKLKNYPMPGRFERVQIKRCDGERANGRRPDPILVKITGFDYTENAELLAMYLHYHNTFKAAQ